MNGYLGDGEFATALLSEAKEKFERGYKLKGLGYDLKKIGQMVSKIYDLKIEEIYSKGRRKVQVIYLWMSRIPHSSVSISATWGCFER